MASSEGNQPSFAQEAVLEEVGRILPDTDRSSLYFSNRDLFRAYGVELGDIAHQLGEVSGVYPKETRLALSILAFNKLGEAGDGQDLTRKERYLRESYQALDQTEQGIVDVLVGSISRPPEERRMVEVDLPFYEQVVSAVVGKDWEMHKDLRDRIFGDEQFDPLVFKKRLRAEYAVIQREQFIRWASDNFSNDNGNLERFEALLAKYPDVAPLLDSRVEDTSTEKHKQVKAILYGLRSTTPPRAVTPGVYQSWVRPHS
ncbi:MAG: hypothetical protein A2900_05005 [Candidatus Chisholmbacteria bacterium RIFCSPLOWO2_01_FULL_50_28]|uniref:Uncharacterized protein n=1 Tax=Candidatus Chisholmbacteria bacterium RIFCSPHIGHO2_01_FULL_52_32 TaxID=1797591 RepID=A0A1G1VS50_9BACT|nr:MAG: hypothetical protein A2786_01735 [Candidatus Chisholmbacteria bacterium RIFCSPHIGHO2_01_FULL_52_32]OGY20407.1 MAG: hypothetical protein A2900_05005 [Candidatus Chisholmbacteria bacterium RIFCSPLOWO2_01_FULL_50_28]